MQIVAHSENVDALIREVKSGRFSDRGNHWFDPIEIIRNDCLPRNKPNGKYKLPSGAVVERENVSISTRFVDYGPEDIDWLVIAGIIEQCVEMYFYIIDESLFMMRTSYDFGPILSEPRFVIKNSIV